MEFITRDMRQQKANLHSHSCLSDGALTPGQLIGAYREHGYSVLAVTDHEAPYDHTAASTEDFLLLTGYEAYIRTNRECVLDPFAPEVHLNLFAEDPHNTTLINYDPNYCKYLPPEEAARRKKAGETGPREYSRGYIQRFIDTARENGYLVAYNHPCWSMEAQEDILAYDGCFSLEVFNTGSAVMNGYEHNMALYDMMLRRGRKIFCHGADDNHNKKPFGHFLCDSFGAWTMLLTQELTYPAVIDALRQGRFYASTGPRIDVLVFEGSRVHMEFSDAVRVIMHMSPKRAVNVCRDDGSAFGEADFTIPDYAPYVYFTVRDARGADAHVRAFTRAELGI